MTTPRELITGALRLINVVQANENPTADDMDISFEALNAMLDSWSNEKLSIFSMNPYEFQLAANQKEYTLGPGGDWEITRPMELLMMYVMYLDGGGECSGPTPPACMDLVLDTFTGTGNLSTHVGEIGASWTPSNALGDGWFIDGGHSISNILLNGDGTLTPDTFRQPMVYPSGSVSLNDTFTFDIEFEVGTYGAGPYTGFLGNLDTGEAYVMNWFASGSYFEIDVLYLSPTGTTETLTWFDVPSINNTGKHKVTVVSTPTVKKIYLDDIYQTEFIDSRITTGVTFMYLSDCFDTKIHNFHVNSCATEPLQLDYQYYGSFIVRNGFDGDVGIVGHVSESNPFYSPFSVATPIAQTNPSTVFTFAKLTTAPDWDGFYDNPFAGAGNLANTEGNVSPMNIGAIRHGYEYDNSNQFWEWTFYFPMLIGDQIWVTGTIFDGYAQSFTIEVVVGPDPSNGESYIVEGIADPYTPDEIIITRNANVGTR